MLFDKIKSHIIELKAGDKVPVTTLFNSHYVYKGLRKYVIEHLKGYLIFETKIKERPIKIYFALIIFNNLFIRFKTPSK